MLIFGFGTTQKQLGEVGSITCENCGNERPWVIVESSKKATLYFVPVAKWSKTYALICPVCTYGVVLESREQAQDLLFEQWQRQEAERNEALRQFIVNRQDN